MPRPRRTSVRKSAPPPQKPSAPTAETLTPGNSEDNNTLPVCLPENSTAAETLTAGNSVENNNLSVSLSENSTAVETLTAGNSKENNNPPVSLQENGTAAGTLGSTEDSVKEMVVVEDDGKGVESVEKQVVTENDDRNNINNGGGGNETGAKPKKLVKKTIKVLRKVIKKVPKKTVDELNNTDGGVNNADDLEAARGVSDASKPVENPDAQPMEVEEKKDGDENNVGRVEGESGNVGKEGEEVEEKKEEGKLFSGVLEAMERRKRRKTEVYVGGLDKDTNEDDVRKVFEEAGEIVDLRVVTSNKTAKTFAFVRYACADDAKRALDKFAKVKICGKECGATPVKGNDTIFLGNINKNWKEEDVVELLNKIGIDKIDKVVIMIDPNNSNCNRGFAFIEFESIRDAQVAYPKLLEKDVFGKYLKLKVAWAEPLKELDEEEMLKVKTVYAEFIPASWDEEKVRDTFKKFGEIDDIVLAGNLRTSKRKDFAFISYKTRVAAVKCIESFGHELRDEDETKVNVKVSLAKPISEEKVKQAAKPVAKNVPRASPKMRQSNLRASETRNRTHPSISRYGIHNPATTSTNVELVRLLREQASWRPAHASLSNMPLDIHYNPLSGRKRQFSLLETDPMPGELTRYPPSHMVDHYPLASSSHNVLLSSDLTNSVAYHHQPSGYPFGSHYGARNYATNIEIRDRGRESSFLHRPPK